jgi:O-acetyl-ADP-ribose deacetylase (regulator of RNase III)
MLDTVTALIRRCRVKTIKPFGKTSPDGIRISLGDINPDIANALANAFAGLDQVEVLEGNLLDLSCDAIVSPANSFGDMGGGIDKAIDDFHSGAAQRAVTTAITEQWFGELPVGAALIVKLSSRRLPFVVAAPTMRIPGNVGETINAYLSMRAALIAILRHNATGGPSIRSLAVPGLCTGVGGMPYEKASEQMRTAYESVIGGQWRQIVHPAMAPYALGERQVIWSDRTDK